MNAKTKGYILGAVAAATYGMNPLFALPLYENGMDTDSVLLFRYLFALPLLGVMLKARGRDFRLQRREILPLIVLGLLVAVSSLTLFQSYHYMDAGIASTLLFVYPILVALIMALGFRERITPLTIFCIALAVLGIGLLYEGMTADEVAYDSGTDNLRVIPATLALINQNELLLAEQSLRFALDDAAGEYDVAIIDTAPSAKQLVLCAYVATSGRGDVIIPVKLDSTVMRGTASVVDSLRLVATKLRLPVPSWRILRTCVPGRMTNAEAVGEAILDRFFPDRQFRTVIHESAKVKEGSWEWKPIVEFMPGNRAAVGYGNLGRELGLWDE